MFCHFLGSVYYIYCLLYLFYSPVRIIVMIQKSILFYVCCAIAKTVLSAYERLDPVKPGPAGYFAVVCTE